MSFSSVSWFKTTVVNASIDKLSACTSDKDTQNEFIGKINSYLADTKNSLSNEDVEGIEKSLSVIHTKDLAHEQLRPMLLCLKQHKSPAAYQALSRLLLDAIRFSNNDSLIQELQQACEECFFPASGEKKLPITSSMNLFPQEIKKSSPHCNLQ